MGRSIMPGMALEPAIVGWERVTRIELALSAWEADVLPLNYTRERPAVCEAADAAR
jgi:hypothetical protein